VVGETDDAIPALLREAIAAGRFERLSEAYAEDALLDASVPGGRTRSRGSLEIAARLSALYPTPGRILDWTLDPQADGAALWLERLGEDGSGVRQRQYLRWVDGQITGHWIYAAPPRNPEISPQGSREPAAPASLLERFGRVSEQSVLDSTGWSGSRLESAVLANGRRLVLKRIVPGGDWLASSTGDRGREGLLFAEGVMGRFPPSLDSAIRAAEFDGEAWWLAMDDVGEYLFGVSGPITRAQNRQILAAMAGVWERFWGQPVEGACSFLDRQLCVGPGVSERERDGVDLLPKQLETFWELFGEAVHDDVAEAVLALAWDPGDFVAAFERCGTTLIHGDLRDEQLGIDGERVIAIDWGLATVANPAYELAWYMMHTGWRIEASHDEIVADFRSVVGERAEPPAIELGMIAGLAQYGWVLGHSALIHPDPAERTWARSELDWWVPRVRTALERTGVA
jgi:hypothetical protein